MRIEQLTEEDKEIISKTSFLHVDKIFYASQYGVLALLLIIVLVAPSLGPRIKPPDWAPPKTLDDYFLRLWPYLIIFGLFALIPLTDYLIRWRELQAGVKRIKTLSVKRKMKTKRWTIIIFEPFHISIFKNFFRLRSVRKGDVLVAEFTSMNRIIDFTVVSDV